MNFFGLFKIFEDILNYNINQSLKTLIVFIVRQINFQIRDET